MKKIGYLGGTFDPIHIGHLMLAEWAMEEANLDEIWFIPTGQSYMKLDHYILPGKERLKMVELAIEDNPKFKCLDIEIQRSGYTYTYQTLTSLKMKNPDIDLYFIMGADCLLSIPNWKHPDRILKTSKLLVATRNDISIETLEVKKQELVSRYGGEIILFPFIQSPISSSKIRQLSFDGKSIKYLVTDKVYNYIQQHHYYQPKSTLQG